MRTMSAVGGLLVCLLLFGAAALHGQEIPKAAVLFQELQSQQTTDQATMTLVKLGKIDPAVRKYLAIHLPSMIQNDPKYSPEPWTNAVRLAGELKIVETAPALAKWIRLDNIGGTTITEFMRLDTDPAGKALAEIGDPAIPALVRVLNNGDARERRDAYLCLNLIGSSSAKSVLMTHVKDESDVPLRKFVQRLLDTWDSDHAVRPRPPHPESSHGGGNPGGQFRR
ncbi:MAG: HEAT repeat domain-containing protein [Candidatus Acidiferrales bacterium]